jgi:serine/threonine protein kinase
MEAKPIQEIEVNGYIYYLSSQKQFKCSNCSSKFSSGYEENRSGHSSQCRKKKNMVSNKQSEEEKIEIANDELTELNFIDYWDKFRNLLQKDFYNRINNEKVKDKIYFTFLSNSKQYFVKRLNKDKIKVMHLLRELEIASRFSHKNLMKTFTFFEEKDYFYVVSEFWGVNLKSYMKNNKYKLDASTIISITKQICEGLSYLHMNHIIHRDIKPLNILIQNGIIKIGDFGLSVKINGKLKGNCGTKFYKAPEVNDSTYTYKSDLWSFGMTLAFLNMPVIHESKMNLEERVSCIKNTNKIPKFIYRLLENDPDVRPDCFELLKDEYFH